MQKNKMPPQAANTVLPMGGSSPKRINGLRHYLLIEKNICDSSYRAENLEEWQQRQINIIYWMMTCDVLRVDPPYSRQYVDGVIGAWLRDEENEEISNTQWLKDNYPEYMMTDEKFEEIQDVLYQSCFFVFSKKSNHLEFGMKHPFVENCEDILTKRVDWSDKRWEISADGETRPYLKYLHTNILERNIKSYTQFWRKFDIWYEAIKSQKTSLTEVENEEISI